MKRIFIILFFVFPSFCIARQEISFSLIDTLINHSENTVVVGGEDVNNYYTYTLSSDGGVYFQWVQKEEPWGSGDDYISYFPFFYDNSYYGVSPYGDNDNLEDMYNLFFNIGALTESDTGDTMLISINNEILRVLLWIYGALVGSVVLYLLSLTIKN